MRLPHCLRYRLHNLPLLLHLRIHKRESCTAVRSQHASQYRRHGSRVIRLPYQYSSLGQTTSDTQRSREPDLRFPAQQPCIVQTSTYTHSNGGRKRARYDSRRIVYDQTGADATIAGWGEGEVVVASEEEVLVWMRGSGMAHSRSGGEIS